MCFAGSGSGSAKTAVASARTIKDLMLSLQYQKLSSAENFIEREDVENVSSSRREVSCINTFWLEQEHTVRAIDRADTGYLSYIPFAGALLRNFHNINELD